MALITLSRIGLLSLAFVSFVSLHYFGEANGTYPRITSLKERNLLLSAGVTTAFPKAFFGFKPLDYMLSVLLVFFWPVVDAANRRFNPIGILFGGQLLAVWTVSLLDASRRANKGRAVSFVMIYGLLVQVAGAALTSSLYLALHLFTSPLAQPSTRVLPADLFIHEGILSGCTFALFVGYIVPSAWMSLPTPSVLSLQSKMRAILAWQPFPVWTVFLAVLAKYVLGANSYASRLGVQREQLRLQDSVYKFALAISAGAHFFAWSLSLSALVFPGLYSEQLAEYRRLWNAFVPPNPFSDTKTETLEDGVLWFLQYDYLYTSAAYLIWAVAVRYGPQLNDTTKSSSPGAPWLLTFLHDVVGRSILFGPMSAALMLVRDRDRAVLAENLVEKEQ